MPQVSPNEGNSGSEAQIASGEDPKNREDIESSLSSALRAALDEEDVAALSTTPQAALPAFRRPRPK